MQDYSLTVDRFLDHAAKWHGRVPVITGGAVEGESVVRYGQLRDRANRLSGALLDLGLKPGDRIATLAWNTQHHLEVWYAAMGVGIVCHTLNPRLTAAQLSAMVNQADDRMLFVGGGLASLADALVEACPKLERLVVLDGRGDDSVADDRIGLEDLLSTLGRPANWGEFDERIPAGLCFTSGTTGAPKGVLYTHRANYLSTLRMMQADTLALTAADTILVAVPMFHANAWGIPFVAPAVGAAMVLPGRNTDGASLAGLIQRHSVTVATGVPTVWLGLLDHLEATGGELPSLKRVALGGAGCPETLMQRIEEQLGVTVQTSWGMTELSPLGTISPPSDRKRAARASGQVPMGLDLRLTDADNIPLPEQRNVEGHLKVRGQSVLRQYLDVPSHALDEEGWFDTGDLALIDDHGALTISGRAKDLIKSGGEWINPVEMEGLVGTLPDVALVAVIGRTDEKWGERPLMVIEPRQGHDVDQAAVVASLKGRVADWWIPDRIVSVPSMPLAATGKIDKTRLRAEFGGDR